MNQYDGNDDPPGRWIDARDACEQLGIKRQTLYAYVSRGRVRSRAGAGSRERDEIERVLKKIAEEGIESITPAEQRLLKEERDRLQQRS